MQSKGHQESQIKSVTWIKHIFKVSSPIPKSYS